ncbi:hypothetical protein GCM10009801_36290 [Streptomyces albiaxialis]|uniref:Integral membrane protein n=1 Tax=Streptomyces albiaxialis TaxID=329523 RepID=A0ABN2W043_9ACTN
MGDWWYREIVEPGKLPLLTALVSFVVTFAVTRLVTRLIRAGRGPFRNVSAGGLHIHHAVPGLVLMVIGGFGAVGAGRAGAAACAVAALFGCGAGLVLDEFALLLHLDDVYWSEEGRKSVEIVVITAALVAILLSGSLPFGVDALSSAERRDRRAVGGVVGFHFVCSLLCLLKGKPRVALFGVLVPLLSLVGAVRLGRPGSWWARRLYARRPRARARAVRRAARHDKRWTPRLRRLEDFLGGPPSR